MPVLSIFSFNALAHGGWSACKFFANQYGIVPEHRDECVKAVKNGEWKKMWNSLSDEQKEALTEPTLRYNILSDRLVNMVDEGKVGLLQEATSSLLKELERKGAVVVSKKLYSDKSGGIYNAIITNRSMASCFKEEEFNDERATLAIFKEGAKEIILVSTHRSGYFLGAVGDALVKGSRSPYAQNVNTFDALLSRAQGREGDVPFVVGGDFNTFEDAHTFNNIFRFTSENGIENHNTGSPTELPRTCGNPHNLLDHFFSYKTCVKNVRASVLDAKMWGGPLSDHMLISATVEF